MSVHNTKLLEVKEAPAGLGKDAVGLVSWQYDPQPTDDHVKVTRYSSKAKNGEGASFETCRVIGAKTLVFKDSVLRRSNVGYLYILPSNMDGIPREVSNEVCKAAAKLLGVEDRRTGDAS